MPITIGSNISSLSAQRRLAEGTSQLSKTYERLSSGQRINRAADDAAGLAISESLKSDRRVFNQGVRNFNDGISLLAIADGAIESLSNVVIRLKELAEQSANGTYSSTQRSAIDKEAQALSKEYTRIVQSTKFNGVHLLNGSLGNGVRLQGGFGAEGSIFSGIGGAIGTGTFTAGVTFTTSGNNNIDIVKGDFNSDGNLDVVTVDRTATGLVNINLGNGDGTFRSVTTYQAGNDAIAVEAADMNNDGILDLLTTDNSDNTISVFIGKGDGTFHSRTTFLVGSSPHDIQVGDFNGDGNIDVATADYGDTKISVLLGNGNGTFQARRTFSTQNSAASLQSGDFNGDGVLDIVAADSGGSAIQVLMGNGSGTFTLSASYSAGIGNQAKSLQVGDLNGDGILDIISENYIDQVTGSISVFLGRSNGTFNQAITYVAGGVSSLSYHGIRMGDLNGDGILDLVDSSYYDSTIGVFIGKGDGTFNQRISYASHQANSVELGDFNNDGVIDIAASAFDASRFIYFKGSSREGTGPLLPFDLKTLSGARQALPVLDQKIQQLAKQRGQIGAFQSRVQVGINNLQSASENYAAAESRIKDADIAAESAQLVRLNILQQAASSVLGQANLQPQLALRLLGGGR